MNKKRFNLDGELLTVRLLPILSISLTLAISGCTTPSLIIPKSLDLERTPKSESSSILGDQQAPKKFLVSDTPKPPVMRTGSAAAGVQTQEAPENEKADLMLAFDQIPLPAFIQAVYGPALKINYSIDGAVAARTDLVTFRTPKPQTRTQMANLTRLLLKSYGIAVQDFGGVTRIVPDTALNSYSPQIRRGRALPDAPMNLRPVFYYVELEAVRVSDFSALLKTMFGSKVQVTDDAGRNAMLISGPPDDVAAVLDVVQVFDQPAMRGQRSKRVSPVFWTAEEFSKRLVNVLTAEGYAASTTIAAGSPILILPIVPLNSIIIFASSDAILAHVLKWAQDLDRPAEGQAGGAYFTYSVKYADAQALAKTLMELISPMAATGAAPAAGTPAKRSSRVVVNSTTNSLIIQGGGPDEYRQWMTLLAELDKPTKSALIDVIVAEVALSDSNSLGFDWGYTSENNVVTPLSKNLVTATGGAAGLTVNFLDKAGLFKAKLTALASNDNAQILSSPKLMARNGETATIQVGDEVPVITSTQTAPVAGAVGGTGLLSTVQYRTTGVILKVRPVINSGNRIDLEISQEVSNAKLTQTGVSVSPTIGTRKVDTKLSVRDGSTVILAGLINSANNLTDSGVPLLKDIPVLGSFFKTTTATTKKTELIIMITPYIINDDFEAESITAAFQGTMGEWARDLQERTATSNLKRVNALDMDKGGRPPLPVKNNEQNNAPVNSTSANGGSQAPTPSEQPVIEETIKTVPEQKVSPTPLESGSAVPAGVVMSKPEPVAAPAPVSKPVAAGGAAKKTASGKVTNGSVPPSSGHAVEEGSLLDELRRAVGK